MTKHGDSSPLTMNPGKDGSMAARYPHLRLCAGVLLQAVEDLRQREDEELSLDALRWLALEDGGLYCGVLGLPDPLDVLITGKFQKQLRRK